MSRKRDLPELGVLHIRPSNDCAARCVAIKCCQNTGLRPRDGLASQIKMAEWAQLIESLPLPKKPANLTVCDKLNKGAWGIVYEGVFDRQPVAVKAIHDTLVEGVEGGDVTVRNFCKECARLKELEHNHVISECCL